MKHPEKRPYGSGHVYAFCGAVVIWIVILGGILT